MIFPKQIKVKNIDTRVASWHKKVIYSLNPSSQTESLRKISFITNTIPSMALNFNNGNKSIDIPTVSDQRNFKQSFKQRNLAIMWKLSSSLWQTFTKPIELIYFHIVKIQVELNCISMERRGFSLFKLDPAVNLTYPTSSRLWNLSCTVGLLQKWFSTWQGGFLKN